MLQKKTFKYDNKNSIIRVKFCSKSAKRIAEVRIMYDSYEEISYNA